MKEMGFEGKMLRQLNNSNIYNSRFACPFFTPPPLSLSHLFSLPITVYDSSIWTLQKLS